MKYEVSERIRTGRTDDDLLAAVEMQFRKISESVERSDQMITAKSIEATFGSINRTDTTRVFLKRAPEGWLLVGDVHYRPSALFWVFLIIFLFSYIGWLIPIIFYLVQKNTVREAIEDAFRRIKNEFEIPTGAPIASAPSDLEELERWAELNRKGVITDSEFDGKKKQILDWLKSPSQPLHEPDDYLSQLEKLGELKKNGVLTDEEFTEKKKQLLASS